MYYIVEVISSFRNRMIGCEEDFMIATTRALQHALKSGLTVEVRNDLGRVCHSEHGYRECDGLDVED